MLTGGFLDSDLGRVLLILLVDEAYHLQTDAIALTDAAAEICRGGDHERGIR